MHVPRFVHPDSLSQGLEGPFPDTAPGGRGSEHQRGSMQPCAGEGAEKNQRSHANHAIARRMRVLVPKCRELRWIAVALFRRGLLPCQCGVDVIHQQCNVERFAENAKRAERLRFAAYALIGKGGDEDHRYVVAQSEECLL